MYGHHFKQSKIDQPRKDVKQTARGQPNREIECPCRCIRDRYIELYMYCCLHLFIYQLHLLFRDLCLRARFTAVYAYNMCDCNSGIYVCVCVCVLSSHLFWTSCSLDVQAGVTQEEAHTGFFIPPSFCGACLYVFIYVKWSSHIARVRINGVRLPILLVVS